MKPRKLAQIARVRAAVDLARTHEHLDLCDCCRADLDMIAENADSPCADLWLAQVGRRLAASNAQNWRSTVRGPRRDDDDAP